MGKNCFISGISGQDGAYLAKLLLEKGNKVIGGVRRTASGSLWRLDELGIKDDVEIVNFELAELTNIFRTIEKISIDELYNLASQSFVSSSFETPLMTTDITGVGALRILESIREINSDIKFYQASSSEMFGTTKTDQQNENTNFHPRSPYAVAKLLSHWATINYRESYGIFAVSGILFNHESPLRGEEFVTRKITLSLARIKYGHQEVLELGNIDVMRDWGFAGDYVKGIWQMMQEKTPDDYVLASGVNYSIREFVEKAGTHYGFNIVWEGAGIEEKGIDKVSNKVIVSINQKFYRPADVHNLLGDSTKAREKLGWKPTISFDELVAMMAEADMKRIEKYMKLL